MEENRNRETPDNVPRQDPPSPATSGENTGTGYLIVHVTTARGAIPLAGAQVDIRDYADEAVTEPATRGDIIASLVSGRDGNTPKIPLPAPPAADSESPGARQPYSKYSVDVTLHGYRSQTYLGVPVFDGITSLQQAFLVPLPENGSGGTFPMNPEYFPECDYPGL